jgi:ADP-glucose pyrophosphorylase
MFPFSFLTSCIIQNTVICDKVAIENNCNLNECTIGLGYRVPVGCEIRGEILSTSSN